MSETPTTPRITSSYLKLLHLAHSVTLLLNRDSHLQVGNAIEIVGKVNQDLSVKVLKATDFGTNFDFAAMNALVDANHRYKEIWYNDN
ncbi:hypothetical protein EYC84_008432 [Monilinia fructicola]|uniref:Replication factor A protein 3 n=1 Tax=Monilinia fructicola TaxID=38448 RepID=A0A5M9JGX6_MONFR|nr:hypothetical protein EYC84_008432 [Monilinia fructicola]